MRKADSKKLSEELIESVAVASGETVESIQNKMQEIDNKAIDAELKKNQDRINSLFVEFIKEPVPQDINDIYELDGTDVVLRVFDVEPDTSASKLYVTLSKKGTSMPYMCFGIAKVLIAGSESKYKPGDIVKLRDFEARTLKNPAYGAWANNPYEKSNAKKVGEEPPEYISNLHKSFGSKMFMLNPISFLTEGTDWITYKVSQLNIECLIKNPLKLVK